MCYVIIELLVKVAIARAPQEQEMIIPCFLSA